MNIEEINELEVYYDGNLVGYLSGKDPNHSIFVYTKEWLMNGFSISPFKLPLQQKTFSCSKIYSGCMFGVFYDCLPDAWGNKLINKFLSQQGINPLKLSLIQRFSLLNDSSLGALTFKPKTETKFKEDACSDFDDLFKKIKKYLKTDEISSLDLLPLYHKGSSTGGSRPKVNVNIDGEEYIVKFPSPLDPQNIGEQEYFLNQLAKKCGLNVNECLLIKSNTTSGYFAAKRFDRNGNKKIHIISLSGLFDLNPQLSQIHYLGFLQTVKVLCPQDIEEAIGRMIFNYLIDNKDDHPRNFSFMYIEEEKSYRLTPFYDITSTPYIPEHMMLVNDTNTPTLDDFIQVCSQIGVNKDIVVRIYKKISKTIKESNFNLGKKI